MTTTNYHTIFELGLRSFPWSMVVSPLIFLAVGLLLIRFCKSKTFYVVSGAFVALMASLFILLALVNDIPNFWELRHAYVSGKSFVVEGIVQDFHPAPAIGPTKESFSVHGVPFSYYAADNTPCFTNAPLHKGPIREGLNVRIHYYDDCIQRIEVLQ